MFAVKHTFNAGDIKLARQQRTRAASLCVAVCMFYRRDKKRTHIHVRQRAGRAFFPLLQQRDCKSHTRIRRRGVFSFSAPWIAVEILKWKKKPLGMHMYERDASITSSVHIALWHFQYFPLWEGRYERVFLWYGNIQWCKKKGICFQTQCNKFMLFYLVAMWPKLRLSTVLSKYDDSKYESRLKVK